MSRYSTTVEACIVERAFQQAGVRLTLELEDVDLCFGYDYPLAAYFLDVDDADYHEFGYGRIVPGTRLSRGQLLDILTAILAEGATSQQLAAFQDAIGLDLPI